MLVETRFYTLNPDFTTSRIIIIVKNSVISVSTMLRNWIKPPCMETLSRITRDTVTRFTKSFITRKITYADNNPTFI